MSKNIVIVESATKTKTIRKYLGKDFQILASYGHVRDLLPKEGAVDPDNDFAMKYQAIEKNAKHLETIRKAVKSAKAIYLATDPDREGEAISWHILEDLKEKDLIKDKKVYRIAFNEITKRAVQEAMEHPRELSMDLVNSQQARRALDYLVGFNLSPLLWKKVRRGLSAGRVQSPALRMIVEREEEIEAFKPREYWSIEADARTDKQPIMGKLVRYQGEKITQFSVTNGKQAHDIRSTLLEAAQGHLVVTEVEKKQRKRRPAPPFITSTLQQEAARKLGYTAQRTMRIAQQLYEGIDVGSGSVGLITYMRTDSVTLAQDALTEIRDFISQRYGKDNLPAKPNIYKTKSKNAQEAHEAIRPTSVALVPDEIKHSLTSDQFKLYNLIWKRAVACQMIHATIDTVGVNLAAGKENIFRTTGSTIANPGFMAVYLEGVDDGQAESDEKMLPAMAVGDKLELLEVRTEQHFTEPPPRFSEASLIKALEENDLGRPSTYATIISTLKARDYVTLEKKRFQPTDVGRVVSKFLTNYFSKYVDYGFTAQLEDELDAVARGEKEWVPLMSSFWKPFKSKVDDVDKNIDRKDVTQEALDEECPKCQKPLSIRLGRRGRFIGCSGYPECDYTRNIDGEKQEPEEPEIIEGRNCPQCESSLIVRTGRYGKFIGCSNYPKCKHMEPLEPPSDTGVQCPECKQGNLLKRKSRYGKIFYSCSRYPDCKYAVWNTPVAESCPKCNWPVLTIKTTKRRGTEKVCPQKECDFAKPYEAQQDSMQESA